MNPVDQGSSSILARPIGDWCWPNMSVSQPTTHTQYLVDMTIEFLATYCLSHPSSILGTAPITIQMYMICTLNLAETLRRFRPPTPNPTKDRLRLSTCIQYLLKRYKAKIRMFNPPIHALHDAPVGTKQDKYREPSPSLPQSYPIPSRSCPAGVCILTRFRSRCPPGPNRPSQPPVSVKRPAMWW